MATKLTYYQIEMCVADGNPGVGSVIVPHTDEGSCLCLSAEHTGGGGERRFLLHVVTSEPVPPRSAAAKVDRPTQVTDL